LYRAFRAASSAAGPSARGALDPRPPGGWQGSRSQQGAGGGRRAPQQRPGTTARVAYSDSLKRNALTAPVRVALPRGEAVLLQTLITHPWLLDRQSEAIARLVLSGETAVVLRAALFNLQAQDKALDRDGVRHQLESLGFGRELATLAACFTHRSDKFMEPEADEPTVLDGWRDALKLHERHGGSNDAREAAELAWRTDLSVDAEAEIIELHNGSAAARLDDESSES
jgi:DNA primase